MPSSFTRFVLALVVLCGALTIPGAAWAQDDPEAKKREAAAHYHEGRRLFDKELYTAAIERFQRAHELFPAPANIYNIAKSYERLGASNLCVESYQSYLKLHEETHGRPAPDAIDVRNAIEKCRLGMYSPLHRERSTRGHGLSSGDGQGRGTRYLTNTDPGTYRLRLTLDGYLPTSGPCRCVLASP